MFWEGNHLRQKLLFKKFRHCAIIIEQGNYWRFLDPLDGELVSSRIFPFPEPLDLAHLYARMGRNVLLGKSFTARVVRNRNRRNCVNICCYILGIRIPIPAIPYILFIYLRARGFKKISSQE